MLRAYAFLKTASTSDGATLDDADSDGEIELPAEWNDIDTHDESRGGRGVPKSTSRYSNASRSQSRQQQLPRGKAHAAGVDHAAAEDSAAPTQSRPSHPLFDTMPGLTRLVSTHCLLSVSCLTFSAWFFSVMHAAPSKPHKPVPPQPKHVSHAHSTGLNARADLGTIYEPYTGDNSGDVFKSLLRSNGKPIIQPLHRKPAEQRHPPVRVLHCLRCAVRA